MPTQPRQPEPAREALFTAPSEPPVPVRVGVEDLLKHLRTGAQDELARRTAGPATLAASGDGTVEPDEPSRRLQNVMRLAEELRTEIAALAALRPPDIG